MEEDLIQVNRKAQSISLYVVNKFTKQLLTKASPKVDGRGSWVQAQHSAKKPSVHLLLALPGCCCGERHHRHACLS